MVTFLFADHETESGRYRQYSNLTLWESASCYDLRSTNLPRLGRSRWVASLKQ